MPDIAKRREQLEDRLAALSRRLQEIDSELDSHQSKDWEELAVEREADEVLERLGESGQTEIVRIRAALKRLDEGEYGYCVKCGNEITEARLDVIPWTPFCRACAG
ncbi:TraR/DksA C4-type zinc finger protein [Roseibacterium sp. SDUM158017]|uniref:TraR/DksA family transcriptional regulator n=1 Tax=Roseicyclus salinarum TaxID=3036773 RepID=UPI002414DE22|nr:TraR/DksA C4-type zinc finger protein [Roseibacterium sp. SDUM158017]MDG4648034.1 TraR/DksA C4-type zinc finger protein [Roseibacterium sp. SDUM158017]